jgi:hypothetical protein
MNVAKKHCQLGLAKERFFLGIDQTLAYIEESQWKVGLDSRILLCHLLRLLLLGVPVMAVVMMKMVGGTTVVRRRRLSVTNSWRGLLAAAPDSHYWFFYNKLLLLSVRDFWKELLCCWSLSRTIIFLAGYNGCKVEGVAWVVSLVGLGFRVRLQKLQQLQLFQSLIV